MDSMPFHNPVMMSLPPLTSNEARSPRAVMMLPGRFLKKSMTAFQAVTTPSLMPFQALVNHVVTVVTAVWMAVTIQFHAALTPSTMDCHTVSKVFFRVTHAAVRNATIAVQAPLMNTRIKPTTNMIVLKMPVNTVLITSQTKVKYVLMPHHTQPAAATIALNAACMKAQAAPMNALMPFHSHLAASTMPCNAPCTILRKVSECL